MESKEYESLNHNALSKGLLMSDIACLNRHKKYKQKPLLNKSSQVFLLIQSLYTFINKIIFQKISNKIYKIEFSKK